MDGKRASEGAHPPCYGERAERRRDIEWARPGTTWPPLLSKALALCHVAAHNEAARWASVILAPGLVFCFPENSLLCRAALRPIAVSFRIVLFVLSCMIFALVLRRLTLAVEPPLETRELADGAISVMR